MRGPLAYTFAALCFVSGSIGRKGFGPGEQEWSYVQVRPNANMFWWLYYTTANVNSYYDRPLVIWLQGGPGGSSTGYGNFEELGPLDVNLKSRNYTWVKDYNVLFIDNPVGTGYSYVETASAFTRTNAQVAQDLVECMRGFYKELPKFEGVPTYITTESYGGKMGAEFALVWDRAQKDGTIKSNLKGVAFGDAWISPIDSVMTWAPFLLSTGMVDTEGFEKIDAAAQITRNKIELGSWTQATKEWGKTQQVVLQETYNVDFYNILTKKNPRWYHLSARDASFLFRDAMYPHFDQFALESLMNGPVREKLGIQATHGSQSNDVFTYLSEDFMKPVIHAGIGQVYRMSAKAKGRNWWLDGNSCRYFQAERVEARQLAGLKKIIEAVSMNMLEMLLNETNLNVFVYTGHMDLIVDTPGTLLWVEKLKWKNADTWKNSVRQPLVVEDIVEGYFKAQDNFRMYWVNRAGHMVPKDNPPAQKIILQDLTSNANK